MSYTKQTWTTNDPSTPLSAARMTHIEDGIGDAHDEVAALADVASSGNYADLTGTPNLSLVAISGSYSDLTGKPTLSTVATTGQYIDLQNKPTLSTVANTGSYVDLINKPTIPTSAADVGAVPTTRTVAGKALSANITLVKGDVGLDSVDNTADTAKNVLSATKLTTARTINGISFDGTANISIGANNITSGLLPVAQAPVGTTITVVSTTSWPARPTSRTDTYVRWVDAGGLGTEPLDALDGDSLIVVS